MPKYRYIECFAVTNESDTRMRGRMNQGMKSALCKPIQVYKLILSLNDGKKLAAECHNIHNSVVNCQEL